MVLKKEEEDDVDILSLDVSLILLFSFFIRSEKIIVCALYVLV